MRSRTFLGALVVGLVVASGVAWGDFEKGKRAYQQGDYSIALAELRGPANEGQAAAQHLLGKLYADGKGVPQDYHAAVAWFRKASEQGNAEAQMALGHLLMEGKGVPKDYIEGVYWWKKAADQLPTVAQYYLGRIYQLGLGGIVTNADEAIEWFRKSADRGFYPAQTEMGLHYWGKGTPRDYVLSHMWFNLAAAQGDGFARGQRDMTADLMTPAQIAEAQALARDWKLKGEDQ